MLERIEDTISPFYEFFDSGRTCPTGATTIPSSWMVIDPRERSLSTLGGKVDPNGRSGGKRARSAGIRPEIEGSIVPGSVAAAHQSRFGIAWVDPDARCDRTLVDPD